MGKYSKSIVNGIQFVLTVIAVLLTGNLIPLDYLPWIIAVVGLANLYGVYAVRNVPTNSVRLDAGEHVA